MRKLFSLFAALTLSVGLWAQSGIVFEFEGNSYHGMVYNPGFVAIFASDHASGNLVIPSEATNPETGITYTVGGIEASTFSNNTALTSITIPPTIFEIGSGAFYRCTNLEDVYVSYVSAEQIPSINLSSASPDLTIHMPAGTQDLYNDKGWANYHHAAYRSIGEEFVDNDIKYEVTGTGGIAAVAIKEYVGYGIWELDIPTYVTNLGTNYVVTEIKSSLYNNKGGAFELKEVYNAYLPNGLLSIGKRAFYGSYLEVVRLPNSLQIIKKEAFSLCTSLEEVTIPASVIRIDDEAFEDCTDLEDVYVKWTDAASIPTINTSVFKDENKITLHVPDNTKSIYQSKEIWKLFKIVDLAEVKAAAAQKINEKVSELTGDNPILSIATQAIAEIYAATTEQEVQEILDKYLGILTNAIDAYDEAKGSGGDLPTEGDCGPTVIITKDDKTLILYNVDDVEYTITECDPV